jgi:flagellar hook-associated protein 2
MASSTVSGVGSGIDTQAIVKALVASEKAPKQAQIDKQTTNASTTLSGLSVIKSALDTYRTAIAKINTATAFNGLGATSSDEKVGTVTVDDKATNGSYALKVGQLATASKVTTAVFAGGTSAVVNSGTEASTLTITQSEIGYDVSLPAGATLQETRDAINTQLKAQGISANILTDANGSRMVLSSSTTGKGSDLSLSGVDALATGATSTAAQNATYSIDGVELESTSNTVTSALSGVNIVLVGAGDSTITVATSTATLKASAKAFVDAYNGLMTAINAQTKVTASTTTAGASTVAGALTGDATMRSLVSSIRNELVSSSGTSGLTVLSQLGINTDKSTGLLAIDDKTWDKAATIFGSNIAELFTGKDGLLSRMTSATDGYAKTGGILASRQTNLSNTLDALKVDQDSLDRRITSLTTTLTAKYTAMDTLVAQLNATSKSIMTTLDSLNSTKTS